MTITIVSPCSVDELTPVHEKPTFTQVARKLRVIRVRILRVRQTLDNIDRMLNDAHEIIRDLEEVTIHEG